MRIVIQFINVTKIAYGLLIDSQLIIHSTLCDGPQTILIKLKNVFHRSMIEVVINKNKKDHQLIEVVHD